MKMKLQTDGEGYIYFNQCLFSFFKQVFLAGISANLTPEGLKLINKEERLSRIIMEQKKKKLIVASLGYKQYQKGEFDADLDKTTKGQTANPMVTLIFSGMCFKTWISFAKHAQKFENDDLDSIPSADSFSQGIEDDFGELEMDSKNTLSKKASSRMISNSNSQQLLQVDGKSNSLKQIKIQQGLTNNLRPNSGQYQDITSNQKDQEEFGEKQKGHQKLKSDIPINASVHKNTQGLFD